MRQARLKENQFKEFAYYHCVSRVVDRGFVFGNEERKRFVEFMREYEQFCEVRVLTFCVMSNHFHVLLEVPKPPSLRPSADAILLKLKRLTGFQNIEGSTDQISTFQEAGDSKAEKQWCERYWDRMWDVSAFMKVLKQRFTQWFNRSKGRRGALWEERFKSVLVEGAGEALVTMAAYIDLNPVRAGLVNDPKDYQWSGYGEAASRKHLARSGLKRIVSMLVGKEVTVGEAFKLYRSQIFSPYNQNSEASSKGGLVSLCSISKEEALKLLEEKQRLPLKDYLKCRVRYFCDGAVFGSKEFVEKTFQEQRERFGPRRKTGARRIKGVNADFYSLRDLQVKVFG